MASRALVLGGGGVTGVAWEIGVLAGLAARGVQLSAADLVVGTSAGSVVGAQLAWGADPAELYEEQLRPAPGAGQAGPGAGVDKMSLRDLAIFGWAMLRYKDPARAGSRIGRMALAARTMPEADRRAVIASRVPSGKWPARRLLITAVDAATGEFTVFTKASGVSLVDAVGASCAVPGVWPPVSMAGRRWIDGGIRSPANADLAAECERVVVLAPVPRGMRAASAVATQAAGLTRAGRAVAVVSPDQAAVAAIGRNVLDPARRVPAARAGHAQARTALDRVGTVWDG